MSLINDDDDDDYYYYSDDVRVKLPVISLEKVLCITGFKVARAQVNFWYSILLYATVYIKVQFMLSLKFLIWFFFPNFNPDISKKIEALAKKKSCAVLGDWKQSISNHLYWCAASSSGDSKQVEAKWLSISNHVTNVHEGHSEAFPRCSHGPLQQERKWLRRGKTCQ